MSDNGTVIGDEMIEARLKNKSNILGISLDELIDRYIRRGLFCDDYYVPTRLTKDELLERCRKEVEKDKMEFLQKNIISMFSLEDGANLINVGGFSMIFLDSGYFIGLMDDKDSHHKIEEYLEM